MNKDKVEEILASWKRRALKGIDSHYESERYYKIANKRIGIPTVVLATVITSLSFFFIGKVVPIWVQFVVGFSGLIQVILTSLHTWLKYSELAQKHHDAGSDYASARRQIEILEANIDDVTQEQLDNIRKFLDDISKRTPVAPGGIWKTTQDAYNGNGTVNGTILDGRDTKK